MPINYVVRKKKDQSGNEVKELYYAVPSAIQNLSLIHISEPTRPY